MLEMDKVLTAVRAFLLVLVLLNLCGLLYISDKRIERARLQDDRLEPWLCRVVVDLREDSCRLGAES